MPTPCSRDGEKVPLVTRPAGSPSASTALPWRGMPRSVSTNGANFSGVPSARARATASEPMNPVSSTQHQPSPASIGLRSVERSLP